MTHWLERSVDMSDLPVSDPPQTLADFLLARMAEDEAEAHDAIRERKDRLNWAPDKAREPDLTLQSYPDLGTPAVVVGPERILAECEAKRRIVRPVGLEEWPVGVYSGDHRDGYLHATIDALKALALVYADHSDYRDEWKP